MKILIMRFSSIGDIVLTTPVIRNIKTQLNGAEVHYVTKEAYEGILSANPYLDRLHLLSGDMRKLIRELKEEKFDVIIDLHNNLRTLRIRWSLGRKAYVFKKLNIRKWLFVNFKINLLPNIHVVDRYMKAAAPLGVKMDSLGLDYFFPEKDVVEREWLPETHQKEYVAFAIGGTYSTKKLPVKRMIELCDRINKPIILLGGKEDEETGQEIEAFFQETEKSKKLQKQLAELNKKAVIFNACGKFNLNQSASILQQARWVFTHDTGLMHIAAAFKKPIYSIWGNTSPAFGMYPYRTQFTIFENNRIKCRPCSKIGFEKCPKGHFKCMKETVFDFYLPENR